MIWRAAAAIEMGQRTDCDAVFLSCTNLRTLRVLHSVEAQIKKPVLSSNQVLAWQMAGQAGDLIQGILTEIDVAMKAFDGEMTQRDHDRAARASEKILTGGTGLAGLPVQGPYRTGRGIYRGLAGE